MDDTSRMVALLGAMRRERNGLAADTMQPCGAAYGLNYGVSLPTVRSLARAEGCDDAFARYLYRQQVRELRLAAFHIADPTQITRADLPFWAAGITNSEIAEEGAFALFSRAEAFGEIFPEWIFSPEPLLSYTALMTAARSKNVPAAWIAPAISAVIAAAQNDRPDYASGLLARGAVAMLSELGMRQHDLRISIREAVAAMPDSAAARYLREELAWRLAD